MKRFFGWAMAVIGVMAVAAAVVIPGLAQERDAARDRPVAQERIAARDAEGPMITHDVYFLLKDRGGESVENFAKVTVSLMETTRGLVEWQVTIRDPEVAGDISDQDYDVQARMLFRNAAALKAYGPSDRHLSWVGENKDKWESVRVFDSKVFAQRNIAMQNARRAAAAAKESAAAEPVRRPRVEAAERAAAERPAVRGGFAGMVNIEVLEKGESCRVKVTGIEKAWEHSRIDGARLVGREFRLTVRDGHENGARFIRRVLQPGQNTVIDVAQEGETLFLLELTEDQRAAIR